MATEFGKQVLAAAEKPRDFEITIEGQRMDDFVEDERTAAEQGQTLLVNDDGTPYDRGNPNKGELTQIPPHKRDAASQERIDSLFAEAEEGLLFGDEGTSKGIPTRQAANIAYTEALAMNDASAFQRRKEELEAGATLHDTFPEFIVAQQEQQGLEQLGVLTDPGFRDLPIEEQIEKTRLAADRLDLRKVTPRVVALIETYKHNMGPTLPVEDFEEVYRKTNFRDLQDVVTIHTSSGRRRAQWDFEEIAAMNGFDGTADAIAQIAVTDMTPFLPLAIRANIIAGIRESAGLPRQNWLQNILLGSNREELRQHYTQMNQEEFLRAGEAFNAMAQKLMSDDEGDLLGTRYALLEQMEAVFTEDVFDGKSVRDNADVWLGNFEGLLESLFTVMVAKNAVKGIHRVINGATSSTTARNVAAATGATRVTSNIDETLQVDDLAIQFGHTPDETAPAMLPRPARFVDATDELPDGNKATVEMTERARSEILAATDQQTGSFLTVADRTAAVNKEIEALDLADGMHVHGRMSTLQMLENDTGYRMRVVIGDTAEGGYKNIEDAMGDLLELDDTMETVTLMRVNSTGVLEPVFESAEDFARALTKGDVDTATAGRIAGGDTADETFYLAYDQERFWNTADKEMFGPETFQSGGLLPRAVLSPNAKFGDEIYGTFARNYMDEQGIRGNFEVMFKPYYDLGVEDKRFVASAFEWMEQFGKEHGRAPDVIELAAKYDGITVKQMDGVIALRQGMDTMHELFNRKLYRDWQSNGFRSARPADSSLPTYHGKDLDRADVRGGGYYDPETGKIVDMDSRALDDLYNGQGRVMQLDMPVKAGNSRGRYNRVILRDGSYEVGELSTTPLKYHAGYTPRFYEDPYYIIKVSEDVPLNGVVQKGATRITEEALRTAGTKVEADNFARRAQAGEKGTATYKVVRGIDISNSESTLFQKETLHREGRMFWDERNADRLPDVNGNRAVLEDPVKALERGVGIAARQLTHEDPLKAMKGAFINQYGKYLPPDMISRMNLQEISARLKQLRLDEADSALKKDLGQAKELIDYFRLIEGTESMVIPLLREKGLALAVAINRVLKRPSSHLERMAMTMDPFQTMRSVAFKMFMVVRPARQALLQSSQIGYLAALKPSYVATPQFFKDAIGLRRGLIALRKSGYDDGLSVKALAKSMGLSEKEYRVLIREFDRSGVVDLVDVHSFSGGSARFRKTALPKKDSPAGTIGYRMRQASTAVNQKLQNVGFNFGERNNLTFTYNLALKLHMDKKGYKSLLEMSRGDWQKLRTDASNLALGMIRPNSFSYQTGALGTATQFLAFSHKAALGLLNANPAIKGADTAKILAGTYLLYGAHMYGARDLVTQYLTDMGVSDRPVGDTGMSLVDVISGGLLDTTFNAIGHLTMEDFKELDTSPFAPGFDVARFYEMNLQTVFSQPIKAAMGPFGNIASSTMEGLQFAYTMATGMPDMPAEDKFLIGAQAVLGGLTPAASDIFQTHMAWKMDQWYTRGGEPTGLRPTMNTLLARAAFGVRSREEINTYAINQELWSQEQNYNDIVKYYSKFYTRMISQYNDGTLTRDQFLRNIGGVANFLEDFPESIRIELMNDILVYEQDDANKVNVQGMLVEIMQDKKIDATEISIFIDSFTDLDQATRDGLKQMIEEAHEGRVLADDIALEALRQQESK